jgi:YHS domain-containing protein
MLLIARAMGEEPRGSGDAGPTSNLLAGAQTTCPVMDGKRINPKLFVDYQGVRIYVCCNACVKAVRKDPGKYMERVKDQR